MAGESSMYHVILQQLCFFRSSAISLCEEATLSLCAMMLVECCFLCNTKLQERR